ncbi:MAG: ATP synthase F1 subunit epsilon [Crocinitomicaceae bacterium]|nr:ATP synthase F1 subunit epsilon [Crocinitomicaceae bacterium]|tara:strand:- start:17069 stop:17302 length:234 start_codon:yes stop_codon:yes gene_type:complete
MEVQIVTPDKTIFSGKADLVVVPGSDGQIGILDNHAPLVSSMQKGQVKVRQGNDDQFFDIEGGVVEVLKNQVIVLAS